MSTALKSEEVVSRSRGPIAPHSQGGDRLTALPSKKRTFAPSPSRLPVRRPYPFWLKLLIVGQWFSSRMALVTIAGALVVYALTVNTNRRLTAATATLERLQEQHQQLTAASAVFKNHIAQTALNSLQRDALHPKDVIFLEAAETPASKKIDPNSVPTDSLPEERVRPKGY